MIKIPQKAEYVINTLTKNGCEAYIVGGCVRDMLMGKTPHDFDVTTSALPEAVMGMFKKTVPTGIKHGTVTVIADKMPIEVTTFRTEGIYSDARHPDRVEFVSSLKEDLSRRDFTVNAIAYNGNAGIKDYFGGVNDIENSLLRAVGEPEKRFREDALRILRLFRFASVLGFRCEENTLKAALKCSPLLESISRERIFSELYKASAGEGFEAIAPLILCGGLDFLKISRLPDFGVIKHMGASPLAFFAFLYYSSSDISETLDILKVSNKLKKYCKTLYGLSEKEIPCTKAELKLMLCDCPTDILADFLKFKEQSTKSSTGKALKMLEEIIVLNEPYLISHLKISGEDLKGMGITGDEIGNTLKRLQRAVICDPLKNTKENLIKEISP